MSLIFQFTEEDMVNALRANGWANGWAGDDWVSPFMNADKGGYTLQEAFHSLLYNKNLVPTDTKKFWKSA